MNNMKLINKVIVGAGGAANIELTNIPQTYTDLIVKYSLKHSNTQSTVRVTINSNTSTNYKWRRLLGDGSSVGSDNHSTYGAGYNTALFSQTNSSVMTAGAFGNGEIYIPNYTSNDFKFISMDSVSGNNASSAPLAILSGILENTSPVTSIQFAPENAGGTFAQYSAVYLYGVSNTIASGAKATGGVVTEDSNYWYHTFFSSGTFTPSQSLTCDFLVIAGGGGGGAGGSGAGGLRSSVGATGGGGSLQSPLSLTAQDYTVTVGAGGASGGGGSFAGTQGNGTTFSSISTSGGGAGGQYTNGSGAGGGSGGGAGTRSNNVSGVGGPGTSNEGYAGGNNRDTGTYESGGGGGGGAGGAGSNAPATSPGYDGGNGGIGVAITALSVPTLTGVEGYYAGGGGGGSRGGNSGIAGVGGLGGGGNGRGSNGMNQAGARGTGGGAGGTQYNNGGLPGGSGLVIVRYAK